MRSLIASVDSLAGMFVNLFKREMESQSIFNTMTCQSLIALTMREVRDWRNTLDRRTSQIIQPEIRSLTIGGNAVSLQEAESFSFFQSGKTTNTWEIDQERYRLERMINSNGDPIIVRGFGKL